MVTNAIPPSSTLALVSVAPSGSESMNATTGATNAASGHGTAPSQVAHAAQPSGVAQTVAPSAAAGVAAPSAIAPILAAAQAALANTVNLSPQAQQAVKLEAFNQLVSNLVSQVQPPAVHLPANWPAGGVTQPLQALLTQMLLQVTSNQPLPQQLVTVQSWPAALTQGVLQQAGLTAAAIAAQPTGGATSSASNPLPALQTWLVQQGVVEALDGLRAFTLTLRVPVAWAQAQAALGEALSKLPNSQLPLPLSAGSVPPAQGAHASPQGAGLAPLPFSGGMQQLASGALGLVMQPQALPGSATAATLQAMRTSAILQLEFQPLSNASSAAQAASVYMPAYILPQDVQAMLQNRGVDPWLLMAQNQQDKQGQKQQQNANEQKLFCNRAGCQYQGRAICAQPFCAEMNYLWSIDRAQRR